MAAQIPSCNAGFQWMNNPENASPCAVAYSLLNIACKPKQDYPLSPLAAGSTYSAPSEAQADPCLCNVPMYTLISACAWCQGQQIISFETWTIHCTLDMISNSTLPNTTALPIELPPFAYIPLNGSDYFDANAAHSASTALPTPTSAIKSTSSPTDTNLQVVIAVVVVATLVLIILLLITLLIYRRRHSKGGKGYFRLSGFRDSAATAIDPATRRTAPPSGWLSRILRMSITGRVSPYQPGHHPTPSSDSAIRKAPTPLAAASALSLASIPDANVPPPLYQIPNRSQQSLRSTTAPAARRIETLPVMQSIVRPTPKRNMSADTKREGVVFLAPTNHPNAPMGRPDRILNIPRPAGFKIEDTPIATQNRAPWRDFEAPPSFDASTSLVVIAPSEDESDSIRSPLYGGIYEAGKGEKLALTTPPLTGQLPVSPPLSVRQLPVSPPLTARHPLPANLPNSPPRHARQPGTPPASQYSSSNARQLPLTPDVRKMPSNPNLRNQPSVMVIGGPGHGREGSRTFPKPPTRKDSFASIAFSNFGTDTTESNFGSSQPPMSSMPVSPAIQSSHARIDDHVIYGGPESRIALFPAAVRAAGYAGVPPSEPLE